MNKILLPKRLRQASDPNWGEPTLNALSGMFKYRSVEKVVKELGYNKEKVARLRDRGGDGLTTFEIQCMSDYMKRRWRIVHPHLGLGDVDKQARSAKARAALERWAEDVKLATLKRAYADRLDLDADVPPKSKFGSIDEEDLLWVAAAAQAEYKPYASIE